MDYMIKLAYAMRIHALRWELEKFAAPTNVAPRLVASAMNSPLYRNLKVGPKATSVISKWGKRPIRQNQIAGGIKAHNNIAKGNLLETTLKDVERGASNSYVDNYKHLGDVLDGKAPLPGISLRKMGVIPAQEVQAYNAQGAPMRTAIGTGMTGKRIYQNLKVKIPQTFGPVGSPAKVTRVNDAISGSVRYTGSPLFGSY
jgi:hypothetical protein